MHKETNIFEKVKDRNKVIKKQKYSETKRQLNSYVTNEKTISKLEYEYYNCDYCGDEIKILKKTSEMTGNTVILPASLTKIRAIEVALCNKCLKPVIAEFEK